MEITSISLSDVSSLIEIENAAARYGWNEKNLMNSIEGNHDCYGFSLDQKLFGYCVLRQIETELELLNIVIHRDYQSMGYGTRLLQQIFAFPKYEKVTDIWLEVRESNTAARQLYTRLGFVSLGKRVNYYPSESSREDAIAMHCPKDVYNPRIKWPIGQ